MTWAKRPRSKFSAIKVDLDGRRFDSKLEASVYALLKMRERAGEIADLKCQVQVTLTKAAIILKPDFAFTDVKSGAAMYAEAKGFETPEWRLKLRLWRHYGPAPLEIWKGTAARPVLDEIVTPKGE